MSRDPLLAQLDVEQGASSVETLVSNANSRLPRRSSPAASTSTLPPPPIEDTDERTPLFHGSKSRSKSRTSSPAAGYVAIVGNETDHDASALFNNQPHPRRRRRWCIIAIIAVLLLLAIFLPLTWFVFVPQYAQRQMAGARLQVHSVQMSALSNAGFVVVMNFSMSDLPSSFATHVSAMETEVRYKGDAVGTMILPEFRIESGQERLSMLANSQFTITNEQLWIAFVRDMLSLPSFTWELVGNMALRLEGTPIGDMSLSSLPFSKTVTLPAFDGLKGIRIKRLELPQHLNWDPDGSIPPQSTIQGIEVLSEVEIDNPSPLRTSLGDIMLALRFDPTDPAPNGDPKLGPRPTDLTRGITLGALVAQNLTLAPGTNHVTLRGALVNPDSWPELNPGRSSADVRRVAGIFFTRYLQEQTQLLGVVGLGARNEFVRRKAWPVVDERLPRIDNTVKWLDNGIRALANVIPYKLDRSDGLLEIEKIQVERINVKIQHHTERIYRPVISGTIIANISVPFGFQLDLRGMRQTLSMYRCSETGGADHDQPCLVRDQLLIGRLESQWDDATTTNATTWYTSTASEPAVVRRRYTVNAALNNSTGRHRNDSIYLQIGQREETNYRQFLREVVISKSVRVAIKGMCAGSMASGMGGRIEIDAIPFEDEILLDGMDDFHAPDGDLLAVMGNLDVRTVRPGGAITFGLNDAYMKQLGSGQVGLELASPLAFQMYYSPAHEKNDLGYMLGTVDIPSLNVGDQGKCTTTLRNVFTNVTTHMPARYCQLSPSGTFHYPQTDVHQELCPNRTSCAGRSFLTEYLHGGVSTPVKITLKAVDGPRDLDDALSSIVLRNVSLPGYTPVTYDRRRAPFPIVRRIIVKPGSNFWDGKLWMWLEFYNPLQVPLRFYYMHVNTFIGTTVIGKLHVNLTNYDPFVLDPGYEFRGYPKRTGFDRRADPYGPHPSAKCVATGDCQIAPLDIEPSGSCGPRCFQGYRANTTLTRRLEVGFALSVPGAVAFWKSLFDRKDDVRLNVTISGQVALGIGVPPFRGPPRNNSAPVDVVVPGPSAHDDVDPSARDPFLHPSDPSREDIQLTWLDYAQDETEMWFRKFGGDDEVPRDPPYYPPECEENGERR